MVTFFESFISRDTDVGFAITKREHSCADRPGHESVLIARSTHSDAHEFMPRMSWPSICLFSSLAPCIRRMLTISCLERPRTNSRRFCRVGVCPDCWCEPGGSHPVASLGQYSHANGHARVRIAHRAAHVGLVIRADAALPLH